MKTRAIVAAALLAFFGTPSHSEVSGVPHEMQFWLVSVGTIRLETSEMQFDASFVDRWFEWPDEVAQLVPDAMRADGVIPKEVRFWLLQPTLVVTETHLMNPDSMTGESRTTTGEGRTTTGESRSTINDPVPYPRARPKSARD
jgi:hypothetical protein